MILAILQARISSSRLPRKVLKPLLGVPMLMRQIERVKRSQRIDRLVVATSTDPTDYEIEQLCKTNNIECFRGSLDDVLHRFYCAAQTFAPAHLVRLTGDCPLIDPVVIDNAIEMHVMGQYDYTSNGLERTFPDGLDVEVFTFKCLEQAWQEAFLPSHREHVTQFFHQNPARYKLGNFKQEQDLSDLRWTVDEASDFVLVEKIYEALYPDNPEFNTPDILGFLKKSPELQKINSMYECNEGLQKSLREDEIFLQKMEQDKEGGK